ncbi:MAG: endonuclease III domain-containing protein [Candidatus Polarisedimenticolia bacterium]
MREVYGLPRRHRRLPPLDELVLTILSQNTTDRNSHAAFAVLKRTYPRWQAALAAGRAAIERAIRPAGLARTKSRTILEALRRLHAERGRLDLGFLRGLEAGEARRYLTSFRGVGEKTACCVLLFSCGLPAFPVDTHIHRVTRRLGWIPDGTTRERSHRILGGLVPPSRFLEVHVNLITLGRRLCRPRRPRCPICPLRRLCPAAAAWPAGGARPILPRGRWGSASRGVAGNARTGQAGARSGRRSRARVGAHRRPQGPRGA